VKKLLAILLLMPAALWAQSAFDGTWVQDVGSTQFSKKPHTYVLDKGMYTCSTCVPKISVKADGEDHTVSGSKYFNTAAVRVVDSNTGEEVDKKDGKTMYKDTFTVSDDGKKLTNKWEDDSEEKPVTGEMIYSRISKGPAGSHAISGSWRAEKAENVSSSGTRFTFQGTTDGLKFSDNNGVTWDAKFDGKYAAEQGDPGNSMMSLKKVNAHSLEYTEKRDGKIVTTGQVTVSADGKKMTVVATDHERNATSTTKLNKE
jgi:hypothetical protein